MRKEEIILTIVIPTYNRRNSLLNTLKYLENQTNQKFYIIILDNCSNYLIENEIEKFNFLSNFKKRISIIKNKYNIGVEGNTVKMLTVSKTKWLWTISDDDVILNNAVEKIYEEIEVCQENIGVITFSGTSDDFKTKINLKLDNQVFSDLNKWVNYMYNRKVYEKTLSNIYIPLNVFNMELMEEFIPIAIKYSFTGIGHAVFTFFALAYGKIAIKTSEKIIVKNGIPTEGEIWGKRVVEVMLQISTISFYNLNDYLKEKELRKFLELTSWKTPVECLVACLKVRTKNHRRYYKLLYDINFKYSYSLKRKIIGYLGVKIYYLLEKTNLINLAILPIYRKLKKYKNHSY